MIGVGGVCRATSIVKLRMLFVSYLKCYRVPLSSCEFEPQRRLDHAAVKPQHTISISFTRHALLPPHTFEHNRSQSTAAPQRSAALQGSQSPPGATCSRTHHACLGRFRLRRALQGRRTPQRAAGPGRRRAAWSGSFAASQTQSTCWIVTGWCVRCSFV